MAYAIGHQPSGPCHITSATPPAQRRVLQRRLEFLEAPASFFYSGDRPQRADEQADLFRRGMLTVARATSRAEKAWLREAIADLAT